MYRGRFAPSPTGPLHLGSLFAAAASYLICLQQSGEWLLRIDDIDPPREMPGAADDIIRQLDRLGFEWSGPVCYQSQRHEAYRAAAAQLDGIGLTYRCICSRAQIAAHPDSLEGKRYPGTCADAAIGQPSDAAMRVRCGGNTVTFVDGLQGPQTCDLGAAPGDYVIWRKDGLPAYHLANVVDDGWLKITDVVRGIDLLESTATHIHLQRALQLPAVKYAHVPVLIGQDGHKLSKQAGARGITAQDEFAAVRWILTALGLDAQLEADFGTVGTPSGPAPRALWAWAAAHWDPTTLVGVGSLPFDGFGAPPQID